MKMKKQLIIGSLLVLINTINAQDYVTGQDAKSSPCAPTASTWFQGGNNIILPPGSGASNGPFGMGGISQNAQPQTDAGTCNDFPFILKANNLKSVFIMPAGKIGINNPNPQAALDIRNPNASTQSSFRIFADPWGNVESTVDMRLYYATGNDFMLNEGTSTSGTSYTNRLFVQNTSGNVGIGTMAPSSKFEVVDPSAVRMNIYSSAVPAASSKIWVSNTAHSFNFGIDNTGIGRIGSNINYANQVNLINFKTDAYDMPLVWIGEVAGAPNTAELSVNVAGNANAIDVFDAGTANTTFKVKKDGTTHIGSGRPLNTGIAAGAKLSVDGMILAKDIRVAISTATHWADYVFEKNYNLLELSKVEAFYKKNKHLPEVPTAKEVSENGFDVTQMNTLLLKKIEELTIYLVEQQKEIEKLKTQIK